MRLNPVQLAAAVAVLTAGSALAQGAGRLDGAYVGLGFKCEDVFVRSGGGYRFATPRNAFDSAFLIRGKTLATPMASCRLASRSLKDNVLDVNLDCANAISHTPVRAYFKRGEGGSLVRLSSAKDTSGDEYRKCPAR
jgi:hypothetical protein